MDNAIYGSAKAWVNMNVSSGTAVLRASYNVSSVTVVSASNYTINLTNALVDANGVLVGNGEWTNGVTNMGIVTLKAANLPTASAFPFQIYNASGSTTTSAYIGIIIIR